MKAIDDASDNCAICASYKSDKGKLNTKKR